MLDAIFLHLEVKLRATIKDLLLKQHVYEPINMRARTLIWFGKRTRISHFLENHSRFLRSKGCTAHARLSSNPVSLVISGLRAWNAFAANTSKQRQQRQEQQQGQQKNIILLSVSPLYSF